MSAAHVDAMNQRLRESPEMQTVTARLTRELVLSYELRHGPHGETVHWTLYAGPQGAHFTLAAPEGKSGVTIHAFWSEMIRAAKANRKGESHEVVTEIRGDESMMIDIEKVLAVARDVATLECEFPEVSEGGSRAP
jgi:hypothetical protein